MMMERGINLVHDPLSRERCFFLATASSRPRHDWILEYAPPFLIIIIFFPSSYLRQAFNTIPNSSVSDTTRHDTIRFFLSFFLSFFLEFEDGNFEHPLKGTDEKAAVSVGRGEVEVGKTKTD